jgi:hypothetical protein
MSGSPACLGSDFHVFEHNARVQGMRKKH